LRLRELRPADWPATLALNAASVRELSELDEQRLAWIISLAERSLAVEHEHALAGFALAIAPDTDYDSENYRWFAARFEDFLYLDRIVVSHEMRRRGIATLLYEAMESAATPLQRMVCEVNLQPPNPASLAFHRGRGYEEIGRLRHDGGKLVALMSRELTSAG
jgi:uncharacterized protein